MEEVISASKSTTKSSFATGVVTQGTNQLTAKKTLYHLVSLRKFRHKTLKTVWLTKELSASAVTKRAIMPMLAPKKLRDPQSTKLAKISQQ